MLWESLAFQPTNIADTVKFLSVEHAGLFDVNRHCERNKHKTNRRLQVERENTSRITSMFGHSSNHPHHDREAEVTKAEALFCMFLIEHRISIATADHFGKLLRVMCPDSKIAQSFTCGRTKATALIKHIAKETVKSASQRMTEGPFILGTNGSQEGGSKMYPIVARLNVTVEKN